MTIRMYARRKGWPLDHVHVDVSHDKVHAQDAEGNGAAQIDSFHRAITLQGDLDADQRHGGCWRLPTNARCTGRWKRIEDHHRAPA